MPEVTTYQPGTFCWAELHTGPLADAQKFYKEIFGWSFEDTPLPQGGVYSMCTTRNRHVCAVMGNSEAVGRGVPPHWLLYVSVANADAAAKRATELGGKVHAGPFDVMDVGRMAVLEDSTGGVFALWEAKKHVGAGIVREPSSVTWNELASTDPAAAIRFYTELFGWTPHTSNSLGIEYTDMRLGEESVAGLCKAPPNVPSNWTVYFDVPNVDKVAAAAKSMGGKALVEPADIPTIGRFAILSDTANAVFGVLAPLAK